jgi:archaemetzincin
VRTLVLIDADLDAPQLNFVFGMAQPAHQRAVVALPRLRESFYGRPDQRDLFRQRLLKEAAHELGHIYGLGHCARRACVMHFSNMLQDTDFKSAQFCAQHTAEFRCAVE